MSKNKVDDAEVVKAAKVVVAVYNGVSKPVNEFIDSIEIVLNETNRDISVEDMLEWCISKIKEN